MKAVVLDADGREHPAGSVATPWRAVPTGAEAAPEDLIAVALAAIRLALGNAPEGRVVACGVTGMAEAGVLLDGRGTPVAPVIAWYDRRGGEQGRRLAAELPGFGRRTGLPPGPLCSLAKQAWLAEQGIRGARWLNVPEWVVHRLGGDQVAELSLASRTGFLEVERRAWWPDALAWLGAPPGYLPEPQPAGTFAGRCVIAEAAGAVLTVAGHDHPCAGLGAGATGPGDVLDSCGTAEALVLAVEPPVPAPKVELAVSRGLTVGWHVLPGRQAVMAGFESGRLLEAGKATAEELAAVAARLLHSMEDLFGPAGRLVVVGGAARRPDVQDAKHRALGAFEQPDVVEAGAVGAALLGGRAAGLSFDSVAERPKAPRL